MGTIVQAQPVPVARPTVERGVHSNEDSSVSNMNGDGLGEKLCRPLGSQPKRGYEAKAWLPSKFRLKHVTS